MMGIKKGLLPSLRIVLKLGMTLNPQQETHSPGGAPPSAGLGGITFASVPGMTDGPTRVETMVNTDGVTALVVRKLGYGS